MPVPSVAEVGWDTNTDHVLYLFVDEDVPTICILEETSAKRHQEIRIDVEESFYAEMCPTYRAEYVKHKFATEFAIEA